MTEWQGLARLLILFGLAIAGLGVIVMLLPKIPWIGRLPGDILVKRDGTVFYAPLTSSLLVSALVSVVLWLLSRGR